MKGAADGGGCFPTGKHYPGIAHLIRVSVEGLSADFDADRDILDIPWVSIDTETTGRDAVEDRVIEIGCVFFRGAQVIDKKGWLINPGRPIPEDATLIHHISDEDVRDKPLMSEVLPEVFEAVRGHLPLAYNAEFDRNFLLEEARRNDLLLDPKLMPAAFQPEVTWIDPLDWARELQKEEKSRALGDVCARLGISLENAHRATDDAEAAGRVMSLFVRDARVPRPYAAFVKEQRRLARLFEFERVRWR